jgi:hypothetical protein
VPVAIVPCSPNTTAGRAPIAAGARSRRPALSLVLALALALPSCGRGLYQPLDPITAPPGVWDDLPANTWIAIEPSPSLRYRAFPRDPATTDAQTPADRVPFTSPPSRGATSPVLGAGRVHYFGGTDYSGNDVDVYDPTRNLWEQSYRPNVPPDGDTFYGSGGSESAWVDPATGQVRPYAVSGYGRISFDPETESYLVIATFCARTAIGTSGAHECAETSFALLAYRDGAWASRAALTSGAYWGLSDYDPDLQGVLALDSRQSDRTAIELVRSDGERVPRATVPIGLSPSGGSASIHVPALRGHLYTIAGAGPGSPGTILLYDAVAETIEDLTPLALPELQQRLTDGALAITWDSRSGVVIGVTVEIDGRVALATELGRPRVWIMDPATRTWTDLGVAGSAPPMRGLSADYGREPLMFDPGSGVALFLHTDGSTSAKQLWAYRYR